MSNRLGNAIKKTVAAASVAALVTIMSACGGDSSGGSSSGGGGGSADAEAGDAATERVEAALEPITDIGITEPLESAPEPGKLVYFIRYNNESSAPYEEPFADIVDAVGWEGRILATDAADPQGTSNAMTQAISAGADYIIINATNLDAIGPGMEGAKAAGVPVFFLAGVDEPEGEANGLYGNVASLDNIVQGGVDLLDWAIADSDGAGDVMFVTYPDAPILAAAQGPIEDAFAENCPQCTLPTVEISTPQLVNGDSATTLISEIRKNPDITYVAMNVSAPALGLREALDSAGLNDVQIGVYAPTSDQFGAVRDGDLAVIEAFGIPDSIYASMDQVFRLDQGMDVDQESHGVRPYQLFSEETIGDADIWDGPEDYADQYLALWNVS